MPKQNIRLVFNLLLCLLLTGFTYAQSSDSIHFKTMEAGKEYKKSRFYQSLWGKHYRKEWTTPVTFKIAMLDTLAGGLVPYQIGGSRQTKSVRLRDKNGREYVLRSIDKTFAGALPPVVKGSFVEALANDQTSIGHPYSALTIAPMAEAIGIYHTNPQIYFIPKQPALGEFSDKVGDALYLFEQRPDENWSTAPNFGNAKDIKNTEKMLEKINEDNDRSVDGETFLRNRLFDMVIGDWGRHEDQWRWAEFKEGKKTVYQPIPRDRDQVYTLFDGYLVSAAKRAARINHLQTFKTTISDVNAFNFPARNLDRHLLNGLSLTRWKATAADIQQRLTDNVIDSAIKLLPPEVYNISGPEIAAKLKSRRNELLKYAEEYYLVLAKSVDVTGSYDQELFEVKRLNDDSTQVNISKINKEGNSKEKPFYSRTFHKNETSEVRLYGLAGEDKYIVTGNVNKGISIRLIGGYDKDEFTDSSHVAGISHKTEIYDDAGNHFQKTSETSIHISKDAGIHTFKYKAYKFDKRGFATKVFYSNEDRFFAGVSYLITKNKWRKEPYGFIQNFGINYSISQNAFSATYKSRFTKLLGKWDGVFFANYDFIRWTNFFGLGNETVLVNPDRNFNRMRSNSYLVSVGAERLFNNRHKISINGFYQGTGIKNDTARYVSKQVNNNAPDFFKNNGFAGLDVGYLYQQLNDSILPTKGVSLLADARYVNNLRDINKSFGRFTAEANLYLPLTQKLGIAVKAAGATMAGTPLFYQYNNIGGSQTVRGYRRERFYGNSSFYNQNELRWITPVHSYVYNGKLGFFALYDVGRVWLKNENSNLWHSGYGGGIILSPYNLITASLSYAVSSEDQNIHIQLIKAF